MHVLITRPQESATSLANRLKEFGHQVMVDSLIDIMPLTLEPPPFSSFEAVVTTSQQAIRCLANLTSSRNFPLWCVGVESEKVARNLGFQTIYAAEGSAQGLIAKLTKALGSSPKRPVLHVSGDVVRVDVVEILRKKGISAQRIVLYKTIGASVFLPETHHALKAGILDAVLFYSPRTAYIFQNLCRGAKLDVHCQTLMAVCLSDSIKTAIQDLPWKTIRIAKKTTTDDLLMALMMAE